MDTSESSAPTVAEIRYDVRRLDLSDDRVLREAVELRKNLEAMIQNERERQARAGGA
jgi:hypothetical protein